MIGGCDIDVICDQNSFEDCICVVAVNHFAFFRDYPNELGHLRWTEFLDTTPTTCPESNARASGNPEDVVDLARFPTLLDVLDLSLGVSVVQCRVQSASDMSLVLEFSSLGIKFEHSPAENRTLYFDDS